MATFLFTMLPTDDLGLVVRALAIAREVRALGHDVICCNPAPAPRTVIADAGFVNAMPEHPLYGGMLTGTPGIAGLLRYVVSGHWRTRHRSVSALLGELLPALPLRSAPASADVWSMDHAAALMGMLDVGFVRAGCRAMVEVVRNCAPDVIVDFWNPFAAIAARVTGTPLATVIQGDAHPLGRGFVWWKTPRSPPPSPTASVNRVLRELGMPPIRRLEDLSVGDLTLVVGAPETDPLPADAQVTYIGATLWERDDAALPAWLEALPRTRPLAWVYAGNPHYGTSGGSLDSAVVLEGSVEALEAEDVDVVLTTGHHELPRSLRRLPAHIRHEPFVPGLAMARRCDVLVHHGGFGSCQAGLWAGKPAVILPTYSERESNARRLVRIGAAEMVEVGRRRGRKVVDPARVLAAVRRVLREPTYARQARAAGDSLRRQGGPARAAAAIARLAPEPVRTGSR